MTSFKVRPHERPSLVHAGDMLDAFTASLGVIPPHSTGFTRNNFYIFSASREESPMDAPSGRHASPGMHIPAKWLPLFRGGFDSPKFGSIGYAIL